MPAAPILRIAGPADAEALSAIGWETFTATFVDGFGCAYPQADLDAFYAESYAPGPCARLLADPAARAWLAEAEGRAVGFATAGTISTGGAHALPHADIAPGDGELKRLYVRDEAKGTGLAATLIEAALAFLGPRPVWLSVWSENHRAQRFYARYGFEVAGRYLYPVGQTLDDELIMRRG